MTPADLRVILLAAGGASRFGSPKLLAHVLGRPMLLHAIDTLLEVVRSEQVVVVLGANADQLEPLVRQTGVLAVVNREHASGMASSVHAGLATVPPECSGVLITLADQVAVTSRDLRQLIECWQAQPERIAAATYQDVVGVPVIFPATLFDELDGLRGDRGARELLRRRAGQVISVPLPSAAVDVDTPEDLASLAGSPRP